MQRKRMLRRGVDYLKRLLNNWRREMFCVGEERGSNEVMVRKEGRASRRPLEEIELGGSGKARTSGTALEVCYLG